MKLSKNKIKQLLKVKNQSQKRVKKLDKPMRGVKKTVGRKRSVNLRNKTLKRTYVGGLAPEASTKDEWKKHLIDDLSVFIKLTKTLKYEDIDKLERVGNELNKDLLQLYKTADTREAGQTILKNTSNVQKMKTFIDDFAAQIRRIKTLKTPGEKNKQVIMDRKVKMILKRCDELLGQFQKTFKKVPELADVYENALVAEPAPKVERQQEKENLVAEEELADMQAEPAEPEPAEPEPAGQAVAPLTDVEQKQENDRLKNTLEHKTEALKYCAETDKDKEVIEDILHAMEVKEESPVIEADKLKVVEEKVNELSQKPCDPLVDIQNHLLMETAKLDEERDEPLTDAEYKKAALIKDYVETSIKNKEKLMENNKNKEEEIAKLTDMLQDIFALNNTHNLRLDKEQEFVNDFNKAEEERREKIMAKSRGFGIQEPGEVGANEGANEVGANAVANEVGANAVANEVANAAGINQEITALRTEIIDLIEHNPDIKIDKLKYGEIEDAVNNWAYTPDAEELEKFKEFKDYLRQQVIAAGENVFGNVAAEDFAKAINDTQEDFDQLSADREHAPQPMFPAAEKDELSPAEIEDIVRKRMAALEEQYEQDKAKEAEVIAKYEGIIQNMKEEDRANYQKFLENIKLSWNKAIQAQENERNVEREVLYKILNQNEDTIKTLQQELEEKQTALDQNADLDTDTIQNLRTSIDDARQKLRGKTEELIKASEEWNKQHEQAEVARKENIDELTMKLQDMITQSNESKAKLEKILEERNALILKGRADLKKQEELSAKLTERIEELEKEKLAKEELEKWSKMDATLKSNIEKNTAVIEEQEQTKRRLTERIEQFENDPNYSEPSREEEGDQREGVNVREEDASEEDASEEEPLQFSNPAFGLEEPVSAPVPTTPAPVPTTLAPASIQTTTTEIGPGINGVQEILVRIQYPLGKTNPGPVMSLIGDTSGSTEAAVVGVMSEQSSLSLPEPVPESAPEPAPEPAPATNPGFNPPAEEENALLGGQKSKNKHKTTRRKKQSYFTKDDFIAF